ncbi:hypothetical protein BJV82DRAFT_614622 [Fennellomyces sp. T-0311]|nr:hypothetical protein BJV82DRAFT_614622 [Fennellomyces sp. T-0311]
MTLMYQLLLLTIGSCLMMTHAMPVGTPEQQVIRSTPSSEAAASLLNQVLSTDSDEDAYFGFSWLADAEEEEEEDQDDDDDGVSYGFVFNLFGNDGEGKSSSTTGTESSNPINEDDEDAVNAAMLMVSSSDIDDNVIEMAILARTRQTFTSRRRLIVSIHSDEHEEEEDLDFMSDT